jgi:transposase
MTLGVAGNQGDLLDDVVRFCDEVLPEKSIYSFLRRERDRLFPDHEFTDLFERSGRRSVPPSVVAVVMVLQRLEGLSDREAVERYCFDNRWRYAAGVGGYDTSGWVSFSHTVLVDMRERLRNSARPDRIFQAALGAAREAGLVGRRRVLDSTPLYDAVATMDTITLIRSAIRKLLQLAEPELGDELRRVFTSGDDYATSAKPMIDWDDRDAQAALVDSRAKDGYAALVLLEGRALSESQKEAVTLLATVLGQDLEEDGGVLRIARRVAKDRVISIVDPETRHGRKTSAHGFDGYKGHVAIDPDTEIITAVVVSAGNAGDASVADALITDVLGGGEVSNANDASDAIDAIDAIEPDTEIITGDARPTPAAPANETSDATTSDAPIFVKWLCVA